MPVSINGTNGLVFADGSTQGTASPGRNRIINGAMTIDQRNAGSAVTINTAGNTFTLDRWCAAGQVSDGVFTVQRSTVAPAGFLNSLLMTVTTADTSVGSTQLYLLSQFIEGLNVADLGWGAAGAASVTLSFWVRCSSTGTFGGALQNDDNTRSYPFTYTIDAANTWEKKTITVAGDTTGTWKTDTNRGISVRFSIGMGSTYLGTANTWAGANYYSATGSTNLIGTNGSTFYITGVQLEKGTAASDFDFKQYGTELALCQRYFQIIAGGLPDSTAARNEIIASGMQLDSTQFYFPMRFIQEMRSAPTFNLSGNLRYYRGQASATVSSVQFEVTTTRSTRMFINGSGGAAGDASWVQAGGSENDRLTASAEL